MKVIYLVILILLAVIILLYVVILFLKSKKTFVLDDASNKPKIDAYNLNDYSYLTELKKFEITTNEIQLSKENIYLNVKLSEGWELFKKENLSNNKIKYYWRKKITGNL